MLSNSKAYNILYVDDEIHNLNSFKAAFRRFYNVYTALSAKDGIEIMRETPIHLIITDQRMPEMTGVEFLEKAIGIQPESIRMILTGYSDVEDIIRAINTGRIYRYITKPWSEQELKLTIDLALESLDLKIRNTQLQEDAIKNALEVESAKFKDQFLANMSHEIRTPMNAIVGMTRLMLKREQDQENLKYLGAIQHASENLLILINDILDISKIQSGKMHIEQIPISLRATINGCFSTLIYKCEEKGLQLKLEIDSSIPDSIISDPTRLNQILINLVGNAIKFTKEGEIILRVSTAVKDNPSSTDFQFLKFEVIDCGIGIEKGKTAFIFDSFTQSSSSTARKYGGSGLGLSITKQLVSLMGGSIDVISEINKGSNFFFTIPLIASNMDSVIASQQSNMDYLLKAKNLKGISLLLVEDDSFNQIVAVDTLESLIPEIKITIAENGLLACEKAQAEKFDIVLMDLQMPELNGYEATEKIRQFSSIPIIAMTADALKTDNDKCLAVGMNDYISKPFEEANLIDKIYKQVNK